MVTLKIKVTKDILEKSKNCKSDLTAGTNCAISLAVRDIFPGAFISNEGICFLKKDWVSDDWRVLTSHETKLPQKAKKFIDLFDSLEPHERVSMKEIEFEIKVPERVIKKININEVKKVLQNHPTLELIS